MPRAPLLSASARGPAHQAPPPPAERRAVARLLGRSYQRGCPTPPPPGHAVAVGLRCGKADTEGPRYRVKLDSALPRNSDGHSTLFPVKEEPTRLATSSPFPSRSAGRKPPPVDNLVPPTGGPFLKAYTGSAGPPSPSRTLTHVRRAPSTSVEQEKPDTARRASGDSTTSGQIDRSIIPPKAEESQLSSSRTGSEPPAPWVFGRDHRGQHEHLLAIFCLRAMVTPGQDPWNRTRPGHQGPSVSE